MSDSEFQVTKTYSVTMEAGDKRTGLTTDDLGRFVQECHRAGLGNVPVAFTMGLRGQAVKAVARREKEVK